MSPNTDTQRIRPNPGHDSNRKSVTAVQKLDPLTGFHQQAFLNQALTESIQSNRMSPVTVSLALLQLENFYEIRTWLGKSEATLFLADIARLLKKSLPDSVVLCRCEHYEFAALLSDQASLDARKIAVEIRQVIESAATKALPGKLRLKIGIGIAAIDERTTNIDVMYARARHDMSAQQKIRRHTSIQQHILQPDVVFERLKQALGNGHLSLSFQAVVSLKEDGMEHYEIRTCARDSQGSIPSDMLFEVAVQNAWGETIDRWLIQNAIKVLKQSTRSSLKLTVSITHNTIVSPTFFNWLAQLLEHNSLLGKHLVFQISEIDILIAQHHMSYFCQQLNKCDIQLCINHFGCTNDPFRYLSLLRAEFVKLDNSMMALLREENSTTSLAKLIEQLHENGLRVIVGQVEKMAQMPELWACNTNFVQGYGFHKPSKALDFEFTQETTLTLH